MVYPDSKRVVMHDAVAAVSIVAEDERLTAPGVLPGFEIPVARLFL